jgi:hypothetical protein
VRRGAIAGVDGDRAIGVNGLPIGAAIVDSGVQSVSADAASGDRDEAAFGVDPGAE